MRKHKKKIFIFILVLLIGGIFYFYKNPERLPLTIQEIISHKRDQKTLDAYDEIIKEADALNIKGESEEAIAKYKDALDLLQSRTLSAANKEEFNEAYGNYSDVLKLHQVHKIMIFGDRVANAYYGLSFAYRNAEELAGNMRSAIEAAKEAVKEIDKLILLEEIESDIDPNQSLIPKGISQKRKAAYLSNLANLYSLHRVHDLSIKTHKQAIKLDPENADNYVWYGFALYLNNQGPLACKQWEKALKIDPDNIDANKFLSLYK